MNWARGAAIDTGAGPLDANNNQNWRGDVNLDGSVDVLDLISTRNKLGARCQ